MKLENVKTLMLSLARNKVPVTPMLWGPHAIGKSSIVREVARELGYRNFDIRLSQKEAIDLSGVLYTYEDRDLGLSVTAAHAPQWFADACKNGKVVLFLDEFNMARREVLNAAFELVLDRKLNNVKLPDDVFIVTAGNPEDERYDTTPMSESLKTRLLHIHVTPDVPGWLKWARKSGIHADVVQFIQGTPEAAYTHDDRDSKPPVKLNHGFRSLEQLSLVHSLDLPQIIKNECYAGLVGPDIAQMFIRSMQDNQNVPLKAEEVLEGGKEVEKKLQSWIKPEVRAELLSGTVSNVAAYLFKQEDPSKDLIKKVLDFVFKLPQDILAAALKELTINRLTENEGDNSRKIASIILKDSRVQTTISKLNKVKEAQLKKEQENK